MNPDEKWQKLAPQFRKSLSKPSSEPPPPGFATRIVALADLAPQPSRLTRLRNWSLGTAVATAAALTIMLTLQEPQTQFIPVPELELPSPSKP